MSNNQRLIEGQIANNGTGFGVNLYKLTTKSLIFAKPIYIRYKRVYALQKKKRHELPPSLVFTSKS